MPRKRMIDPEFWSDEEIGQWSRSARLLYIALWNFADDAGRFKASSGLLIGQIFPYDNPKTLFFEKLKQEVSTKIIWYEVAGCQYGFIRNFLKHQRIDRPYPSKLPAPPANQFDEDSTNTRRTLAPNIKEVNIREDKQQPTAGFSENLLKELNRVSNDKDKNLNIFALITQVKKQLKWGKNQHFPEEVLFKVCEAYWREKDQIRDPWPWFVTILKLESGNYYANNQIREHQQIKSQGGLSLAQILEGSK